MKAIEWFVQLEYEKAIFYFPHAYVCDTKLSRSIEPEIFMDFDKLALTYFNAKNTQKHPAILTIQNEKNSILATSAIPSIQKLDLKKFTVPGGVLKNIAKKLGIVALSFSNENKLSIILNPEKLYFSWREKYDTNSDS